VFGALQDGVQRQPRVSGQTWTDFRASGKCNNGQLPVLEAGGQCLNQSESIIRFVGSQTGVYNTAEPSALPFLMRALRCARG
jgi:hypothetical protein